VPHAVAVNLVGAAEPEAAPGDPRSPLQPVSASAAASEKAATTTPAARGRTITQHAFAL